MNKRKFNWASSADKFNEKLIDTLDKKMSNYYTSAESRESYQQMLNLTDNDVSKPGNVTTAFIDYVVSLNLNTFLEIGCGSGRIYQFLKKKVNNLDYVGIEVSEEVVKNNKVTFPETIWKFGNVYELPADNNSIEVCFSFYVLEHLCYPERALIEMMRVIKPGGFLILIFPDFVASGRFASQFLGLSDIPTAKEKLLKFKFLDVIISIYDSRFRLPRALKNASKKYGSFPVNTSPKCLDGLRDASPDIDAVYITNKYEIEDWANSKGYKISYPNGTEKEFADHAFLSIQKA
ncbi:hypothetical protein A5893_14395 [Pedobacter psychrophilus]|uniref:Methyltransferase type 11 domain-containing protein n=1 Tax=Pedobacter psychrophilus TaxID=1826909 RepID=A0A179DDK1_9SPHI|nr:class I SAM-dependent methyltransferase [Pedobacter psychrophilus]OAQ38599.1 hypothetical protein A5893_14395 [Pedobacter psychrophilus]